MALEVLVLLFAADAYEDSAAISDPFGLLVLLGATVGFVAGFQWFAVFKSIRPSGEVVQELDRRKLATAALLTSAALLLGCIELLADKLT